MLNEYAGRWWFVGFLVLLAGCPRVDQAQPQALDAGELADAGEHTPPEPPPAVETPKPTRPSTGPGKGTPSKAPDAGAQPTQDTENQGGPADMQPMTAKDAHFFVPTGEALNTSAPVVRSDRSGATHMLYPLYGSGGAYYAYCADGCSRAQDITPVLLSTEGSVTNAALALTADGKPRALLSTLLRVYYAQCDQHCTEPSGWTIAVIDDHQGVRDVTGQALALDPQGRPRFVEHTYLAYLGVGQKPPATWYMQCDEADCMDSESWQRDQISDKICLASQLQYSADGRAHLLTAVENADGMSAGLMLGAYLECEDQCTSQDAWSGVGLTQLYESTFEDMKLSLALALTKQGQPRLALLERGGPNGRRLLYFECDEACYDDHWQGAPLSERKELGSGLDLDLDARDYPRIAFTLGDAIGYYACDATHCTSEDADWGLRQVELASDLPKDDLILWPNCTIDAWILNTPSLALSPDGKSARVGYVATDLSGGVRTIDPTKPSCLAGKDMVLSRMAVLSDL